MNKKRLNGSNIVNNLKSINFGYMIQNWSETSFIQTSIIRFQLFND